MITLRGGIGAYRSLHALRRSRTGSAHLVLGELLFALGQYPQGYKSSKVGDFHGDSIGRYQ